MYPFLMAFVIVVTANHFIFDALLGARDRRRVGLWRALARAGETRRVALLGPAEHPPRSQRLGQPGHDGPTTACTGPTWAGVPAAPGACPHAPADRLGRSAASWSATA